MEGDTPAFLGLIPNGLNVPEHPGYGGWGGRYRHYIPEGTEEMHPIWTNASDTVGGADGETYTSPQATIWRWRMAFQNDYAARMQWTMEPDGGEVRPPVISAEQRHLHVKAGSPVALRVKLEENGCTDVNMKWYGYREAGTQSLSLPAICQEGKTEITFTAPEPDGQESEMHVIFEASTRTQPFMTRYYRFIITITV